MEPFHEETGSYLHGFLAQTNMLRSGVVYFSKFFKILRHIGTYMKH